MPVSRPRSARRTPVARPSDNAANPGRSVAKQDVARSPVESLELAGRMWSNIGRSGQGELRAAVAAQQEPPSPKPLCQERLP